MFKFGECLKTPFNSQFYHYFKTFLMILLSTSIFFLQFGESWQDDACFQCRKKGTALLLFFLYQASEERRLTFVYSDWLNFPIHQNTFMIPEVTYNGVWNKLLKDEQITTWSELSPQPIHHFKLNFTAFNIYMRLPITSFL